MLDRLKIPKNLRKKIDNELQSGEHLKWIDQPIPRLFTASSIFFVLLGTFGTSMSLFWMLAPWVIPEERMWSIPVRIFLTLSRLPFVLVSLIILSIPIWQWRAVRETAYLITDQRAILFKKESSMVIKSYLPEQLNNLYRKEKANGTGDVIIEVEHSKDSDGDRVRKEFGFLKIRNPRKVENMLKQLAEKAS